jgi:hypothetical protein
MKIHLPPTWHAILPILIEGAGRRDANAIAELERLAQATDAWNEQAPILREAIHSAIEAFEALALIQDTDEKLTEELRYNLQKAMRAII